MSTMLSFETEEVSTGRDIWGGGGVNGSVWFASIILRRSPD